MRTGARVMLLQGHRKAVTALHYDASGAFLASGSRDTTIVVWDIVGQAGLFRSVS